MYNELINNIELCMSFYHVKRNISVYNKNHQDQFYIISGPEQRKVWFYSARVSYNVTLFESPDFSL